MIRMFLRKSDIYTGDLILVNSRCGLKSDEETELVPVMGRADILLKQRAAKALEMLIDRVKAVDSIVPVSGWRSFKEQRKIWDDTVKNSGEEFTKKFVAIPGHSEHQTGLAIDLGIKAEKIDFICPEFPYDGICGEFRRLAPEYGFVERYPAGKEAVTGIGHEPWHFRYVGRPHAELMVKMCLTLEEYTEYLRGYVYGQNHLVFEKSCEISYLPADGGGDTALDCDDDECLYVSGDNEGGFIITKWRLQNGNP